MTRFIWRILLMLIAFVVSMLSLVAVLSLYGPLDQLLGAIGVPDRSRYKFERWYDEHLELIWIGAMTVVIAIPAIIWFLISGRRRRKRKTSADASNHSDENQ